MAGREAKGEPAPLWETPLLSALCLTKAGVTFQIAVKVTRCPQEPSAHGRQRLNRLLLGASRMNTDKI